jgi:hypothetical protein
METPPPSSPSDITSSSDINRSSPNYLEQLQEHDERDGPSSSTAAAATRVSAPVPPFKRLRRKSTARSKLPLERVPSGSELQSIVLPIPTSLSIISHLAQKLDMARNSVEWGFPPDDAYDAFAVPPTEGRVRAWCAEIEAGLMERYEREREEGVVSGGGEVRERLVGW